MINWNDFDKVDMRVGTVMDVLDFPEARNPAYKLTIDFGEEIGIRKSSAQITEKYNKAALLGKQIVAVLNFPPKQIANFMSECLVLGIIGEETGVVLLQPTEQVANGLRVA